MGIVSPVDGGYFRHVCHAGRCFRRTEWNDYAHLSERRFFPFRRAGGRRGSNRYALISDSQSRAHDGIRHPFRSLLSCSSCQRRKACRTDCPADERSICGKRRIPSELYRWTRSQSRGCVHRYSRREPCAAFAHGGFENPGKEKSACFLSKSIPPSPPQLAKHGLTPFIRIVSFAFKNPPDTARFCAASGGILYLNIHCFGSCREKFTPLSA